MKCLLNKNYGEDAEKKEWEDAFFKTNLGLN